VLDLTSPVRTDRPDVPVLVGQPRPPCGPQSFSGPRPQPLSAAPQPTATTAPAAAPQAPPSGQVLARTGLDLPTEVVGAGFLLGAWGLYHLKRTGESGPLPLAPVVDVEPAGRPEA
jgi:hypothetical protein